MHKERYCKYHETVHADRNHESAVCQIKERATRVNDTSTDTPRRYAASPEERARVVNDPSNSISGNQYIAVIMRDTGRLGRVPFYRNPEKCDHGFAICPTWECVESWTMDYRVLLHRTGAGRVCAEVLDVDPQKVADITHTDLSILKIDDYRYDDRSV